MMLEVLRYFQDLETGDPSLTYAWTSLVVTLVASVALWRALGYMLKNRHYSHWLDAMVVLGAAIGSLTYAIYYALLLSGWVTTAASPILLRPVNVFVFAGLFLLARLVVLVSELLREREELSSSLLYLQENWYERVDDIQHPSLPVSGD